MVDEMDQERDWTSIDEVDLANKLTLTLPASQASPFGIPTGRYNG